MKLLFFAILQFCVLQGFAANLNRNSDNVYAPHFLLPIPPRPDISDVGDKRNMFLLSLYIIDIIVFVILIYIIKCSGILHRRANPSPPGPHMV